MKIGFWQIVLVTLAILYGSGVSKAENTPGYITIITTSVSVYDYHTSLSNTSNRVTKHTKPDVPFHISRNLHDGGTPVVIGSQKYQRTLILTDSSVLVYKDDFSENCSVLVGSLDLQPGCSPWYILVSTDERSEKFYVIYRPDCPYGYTKFFHHEGKFSPPSNQLNRGIILPTKDYQELIASIEEDGHKLQVKEFSTDSSTLILASEIADCSVLQMLYPLVPLSEGTVSFGIACETADGTTKVYHTVYAYTEHNTHIVTNQLDPGTPKSHGEFVLVIGNDGRLTLYNGLDLERGVPGRHPFMGEIKRALFTNNGWLLVQVENSDVFAVHIVPFIVSRGGEGVFRLSDTNIGLCEPTCLPAIAFSNHLAVFKQDTLGSYTVAVFNIATGTPQEVKRVPNIPERPFAAIFIDDPSPIVTVTTETPEPTTQVITGPEVGPIVDPPDLETDSLRTILGSTIGGFCALLIATVSVIAIAWCIHRRKWQYRSCPLDTKSTGGSGNELAEDQSAKMKDPEPAQVETTLTNPRQLTIETTQGNEDRNNADDGPITPKTPLLPVEEKNQPVIRQEEGEQQQETEEGEQGPHSMVLPQEASTLIKHSPSDCTYM